METRNIMVIGIWTFAIVWLVGTFVLGADALVALFIFLVAIVISVVATELPGGMSKSGSQVRPSA